MKLQVNLNSGSLLSIPGSPDIKFLMCARKIFRATGIHLSGNHIFSIIVFILGFIIPGKSARGQVILPDELQFTDHIFSDKIRTVQLYKEGWNLSYPVIKLAGDEKLKLEFDLLDDQAETFYYTFIHCNKDWGKSDIFQTDYIEGYPENPIENYRRSFNTTVRYFHYNISFPNEKISLRLSGNYALIIYPEGKADAPVIIKRFVISEEAARIDVTAHRPKLTRDDNTFQQIDFKVNYSGLTIADPYRDFCSAILQNGRWQNAKQNLKPDLSRNNELEYNSLSNRNIFPGGNEYRYFDIKSIRHQTENVRSIDYAEPNYNVYLLPSEDREFKPYFYSRDFNGKYYIAIQEGKQAEIEADYINVFFTLPSKQEIPGGKMYISGSLSNWEYGKNNQMTYNFERKEYECTMLLKQGWYNYEYVFLDDRKPEISPSVFEGNHYETENDYIVLVYYRNPHDRYDRVIGSAISNTLNRMAN